jgi:hypothetical protein
LKGVVVDVRAAVVGDRLKVGARVSTQQEGLIEAFLPDREVAAFLPRSLLLGARGDAPRTLLASLTPILRRFVVGRDVRVWSYEGRRYFSFRSWRSVRFRAEDEPAAGRPAGAAAPPEPGVSADASTRPA